MSSAREGWTRVRFGDVVRLSTERCTDPLAQGIDRYVGLEHLEPGDLRIHSWGNVADGVTFTNRFRPGQVLFGKRRAYQRKVAVAEFDGICSSDIYVLEPADDRLLSDLLPFICQTEGFFEHALKTSAGSLSPRTNWTSLANYEFDVPSIEGQRVLLTTFRALKTMRESLNTATLAAGALERSFLADAMAEVVAATTTRVVTIGESGHVMMGRQRSPAYTVGNNPCPYLRVANVFDDYIDTSDILEMDFDHAERRRYQLAPGDILLNEGQSLELLGRCAMYRGELSGTVCFQNTLIRYQAQTTSAEFAFAYMRHLYYSGVFAGLGSKTTSIAHLGLKKFAELPFPIPATDWELTFVRRYTAIREAKTAAQQRNRRFSGGMHSLIQAAAAGGDKR
jgi:type I restriction enzyme S subunit